jgi:hypothetical protein
MAYRVLTRSHRPNTTVEWYSNSGLDEELNAQVMEMMFGEFHGKKVRTVTEPDELTLEVEFIWETKALYEDYASRSLTIQSRAAIAAYNDSVGIIADPKIEEEV